MAEAISSAMPQLDGTAQRVAAGIYRLLAEGEPVTSQAVARAVDVPVARVEEALNSWPGVDRDDEGRVVGFWGLAIARLEPEYRFLIDGKTSYAWCALDTLFIPAILGKTVGVEATCLVTGERVSLVVDRKGVRELRPAGAVVSMVIPDGPFGYDVIESFCHRVLFFASEEAGATWAAEHEGTTLLSVQEALELGRAWTERFPPDVLGARS
jgi:alkylmercury lyase